jgi:N-acyl-D-amino-acid deacylase
VLGLLISGATVVDGTGSPGFTGSVGVEEDRIVWVGRDGAHTPEAARVLDASGSVVTPGFVDVHRHSDLSPLVMASMPSTIRQGVTTVVVGNCGSSPWPLAGFSECVQLAYGDPAAFDRPAWAGYGDYLEALDEARPAANIATLVGHGSIRWEVLGLDRRAPDDRELASMSALATEAVEAGAFGVSSGLVYAPGMFAETDELVALAGAAGRSGGLYASHIRGEGAHLFRAVDEAVEIGRRARLPAHVSHLKCESSRVWGRADELLERLHGGGDVTGDQYPYAAWNSSLSSLLPPWAPVGDVGELAVNPTSRARLQRAVEEGEPDFQSSVDGVGWNRIMIVSTKDGRWNGRDVSGIAEEMGFDPFATFVRLLVEDPDTSCIGHAMHEDDVRRIAADPEVFVASDASSTAPDGAGGELPVHPREYGTFPRVLARYVREQGLLSLEAAVRKMTSLPADRFGLTGRGRIVEGALADLVVLEPSSVADEATFERPHAFPTGIGTVVVNGRIAWDGASLGEQAGRVLRRT